MSFRSDGCGQGFLGIDQFRLRLGERRRSISARLICWHVLHFLVTTLTPLTHWITVSAFGEDFIP